MQATPFLINIGLLVFLQLRYDLLQYLAPENLATSIAYLRESAAALGPVGPFFVLGGGSMAVLLNIPAGVVMVICIALYGWLIGGLLAFCIFLCGLCLVYLVASLLGRPVVEKLFGKSLKAVNEHLEGRQLISVITLRLAFYMNPVANWFLCVSNVGLRNVLIGTLIGAAPIGMIQIWLVTTLIELAQTGRPFDLTETPELMIRLIIGIGLLLGLRIWWPAHSERKRRLAAARKETDAQRTDPVQSADASPSGNGRPCDPA